MAGITHKEFLGILRSAVINHRGTQCSRLNSFLVVDKMRQLNADNAEMTFQHYQNGLFWDRDWSNGGAKPSNLAFKYDSLVVRAGNFESYRGIDNRDTVRTFFLNVVGQVDCSWCPKGCNHTKEGRRIDVLNMANEYMNELRTYAKYEIVEGADTYTAWASAGQVGTLVGNGTWASATETGDYLFSHIVNTEVDFFVPDWNSVKRTAENITKKTTLVDGVVAIASMLHVRICDETQKAWKYDVPDPKKVGVVRCDC